MSGDEAAPRAPDPLAELEDMLDKARARADQLRDVPRSQEWGAARSGSGQGSAAGAEVLTLYWRLWEGAWRCMHLKVYVRLQRAALLSRPRSTCACIRASARSRDGGTEQTSLSL